jgi:arabinogalactan endo-1,4-beta-galactosidase
MFTVDSVGKSGGLGLFWGEETKVKIINYSHRNINAVICDPITHMSWKFTDFYGQPDLQKRREAWELLKYFGLPRSATSDVYWRF